jgi:hypothetical protein
MLSTGVPRITIEFGNEQPCAFGSKHPTDGAPEAVGPIPGLLSENADNWPFLIISEVTCR